jgi:hypothetical protein
MIVARRWRSGRPFPPRRRAEGYGWQTGCQEPFPTGTKRFLTPISPPDTHFPHGARFELDYDSVGQTWSGTLTIPTPGRKPSVLTDKASGVFGLLSKLDGQYREIEGKPEQSPADPAD